MDFALPFAPTANHSAGTAHADRHPAQLLSVWNDLASALPGRGRTAVNGCSPRLARSQGPRSSGSAGRPAAPVNAVGYVICYPLAPHPREVKSERHDQRESAPRGVEPAECDGKTDEGVIDALAELCLSHGSVVLVEQVVVGDEELYPKLPALAKNVAGNKLARPCSPCSRRASPPSPCPGAGTRPCVRRKRIRSSNASFDTRSQGHLNVPEPRCLPRLPHIRCGDAGHQHRVDEVRGKGCGRQ